jgi:hypothetical protein
VVAALRLFKLQNSIHKFQINLKNQTVIAGGGTEFCSLLLFGFLPLFQLFGFISD